MDTQENSDDTGTTSDSFPLHKAVRNGDRTAVAKLIKDGVDPNSLDSRGETALHWAAFRGPVGIITLLLNNGVDPHIESANGETALDIARESQNKDAVKRLKE
jgi:ankyrin repeat protein